MNGYVFRMRRLIDAPSVPFLRRGKTHGIDLPETVSFVSDAGTAIDDNCTDWLICNERGAFDGRLDSLNRIRASRKLAANLAQNERVLKNNLMFGYPVLHSKLRSGGKTRLQDKYRERRRTAASPIRMLFLRRCGVGFGLAAFRGAIASHFGLILGSGRGRSGRFLFR